MGDGRLPDRFWAKVSPDTETGCWRWTAAIVNGYGRFNPRGQGTWLAHRAAYIALVGPVPGGLPLDHLCRNRACVNPAHLEPVTNAENILRGEGYSAINARVTHCPKGHPLFGDNLWVRKRTWGDQRECRQCHRNRVRRSQLRRREREGLPPPLHNRDKTHCKRGHELSGENIYLRTDKKGRVARVCRVCVRERTAKA